MNILRNRCTGDSLIKYIKSGNLGAVKFHIKAGVALNEYVIYRASCCGHLEIVKELIRYKAPVNEDALRVAKTEEIKEVLYEYIKK